MFIEEQFQFITLSQKMTGYFNETDLNEFENNNK